MSFKYILYCGFCLLNYSDMEVTSIHPNDTKAMAQTVGHAADILAAGGLVVFPTETVYGIAASAACSEGLEKLREFKQRPASQPFTLHLSDTASVDRYADTTGPLLSRLLHKSMPGPITLVLELDDKTIEKRISSLYQNGWFPDLEEDEAQAVIRDRLYSDNTIGVRCPDMPITQQIIARVLAPVVASSANPKGGIPPLDADEAAQAVGDAAALIIDGGRCRYGKASTIVQYGHTDSQETFDVRREGVLDERSIRKMLQRMMLLVCSGNTCRSPMAAGLARKLLAEQLNVDIDNLKSAGWTVNSAGTYAFGGMPAASEAVEALKAYDSDISRHHSQALTPQLIHEADVIYCMTGSHRAALLNMIPSAETKTFLLDPDGEINDPIGGGQAVYHRCAEVIHRLLSERIKEHLA
jgi:tRNA A37 threonylcarbamoyladenosine synthetase subunit TsaC/SUA5/YrdC/protein-tyrosine-phosphatase